jgi:3-oxoadipate enol-lactonase
MIQRVNIGEISLGVDVSGNGPPLLLVHGFPLDHSMWQAQIAEFATTHRVIAPDLRGFGLSDASGETVTMEQFADDLAALLGGLSVTEPVVFCGLSMGGYVAWQFFARHRAQLSKLILCDTRAAADSPEAAQARLATAAKVLGEGAQAVANSMPAKLFAPAAIDEQPNVVAATRQVMLNTRPQAIAAALRGMAERADFRERLATIDVPTLVVCGTFDSIVPLAEMRDIAAQIPHAQFAEIPAAGHMSPLEQPAAVNEVMRKFMGE